MTDPSKGFGHLSRCLILAEAMRKKGFKFVFFINNYHQAIKKINRKKFNHVVIPSSFTYKNETRFLKKMLNSDTYEAIIIDMREYGQSISKNLSCKNFKTILLDDAWCKKTYSDLIINGTIIKKYHKYEKVNKNSKIMVGSKYWIMRDEFRNYRKKTSDIQEKKNYKIIISIGGSDQNLISLSIVKALLNFKNIQITVIVGSFFSNILLLNRLAKSRKNISIIISPKKIWKEFKNADVAISSSGNTLFELTFQRIPTLCIAAVKHQIPYCETLAAKGSAVNLGLWKDVNDSTITKALTKILNSKYKRRKMSISGSKVLDGKGLSRVIKSIEILIKN